MTGILNILIGAFVLILGIPIGNFLAKYTKDESKEGQKWFKIIVFVGIIGGFIGLIIGNDAIMFSLFFISIVSSKSLRK